MTLVIILNMEITQLFFIHKIYSNVLLTARKKMENIQIAFLKK